MTSFKVDTVTLETKDLNEHFCKESVCGDETDEELESLLETLDVTMQGRFEELLGVPVQSCSIPTSKLVNSSYHGTWPSLIAAAQVAFAQHHQLVIDPDSVWVTIQSGIARHINTDPEGLRKKFVNFDGKQTIEIIRDDFVFGDPNNYWEGCFSEFSDKISEYIGDKRDLIVSNFSTTTPMKKAVSEIVLMDTVSSFFDFSVLTRCGIPSIKIEGTVSDWRLIGERLHKLNNIGLTWWVDQLRPVIHEIMQARIGSPDIKFWKSFYNQNSMSGGPYVNGHITKFYPYLYDKKNDFKSRLATQDLRFGISQVPFNWIYHSRTIPMDFVGGLIGVEQDADGSVRPAFGWAVKESSALVSDVKTNDFKLHMIIYDADGNIGTVQDCVVDFGTYPDGTEWQKLIYLEVNWNGESRKHCVTDTIADSEESAYLTDGLYTKYEISPPVPPGIPKPKKQPAIRDEYRPGYTLTIDRSE